MSWLAVHTVNDRTDLIDELAVHTVIDSTDLIDELVVCTHSYR